MYRRRGKGTAGSGTSVALDKLGRVATTAAPLMRPQNRLLGRKYATSRPVLTATNAVGTGLTTTITGYVLAVSAGQPSSIGATAIYLTGYLPVGTTFTVDTAGNAETLTVAAVADGGASGALTTLTTPATKAHAAGVAVTANADYALTLTGNQIAAGQVFSVYGGIAYQRSGGGVGTWVSSLDPSSALWQPPFTVEFCTDAPAFAFVCSTSTGTLEIWCNEELIHDGGQPSGGSWTQVDWNGVRAPRSYRIKGVLSFDAIRVSKGDSVWKPVDDRRPRAAVIGDSYSQARATGVDTLGGTVCEMMGWKPLVNAQGGTAYGFPVTPSGTASFKDRVADIIAAAPDIVLVLNHNAGPQATIAADTAAFWNAIRAALPKAVCIAGGLIQQSSVSEMTSPPFNAAIQAAVEAVGGTYINMAGMLYGSGNVGNLKGDGNADLLVSADATHPTSGTGYTGTVYLVGRIVEKLTGVTR